VRVLHRHTRYQQLGISYGRAKKALWPLLSKRLAQQLDSLEADDEDYYRHYGGVLRTNIYKTATPCLKEGLFSDPNDAATPRIFRILGSRAIGENRVDVELGFTTKQTCSPTEDVENLTLICTANGMPMGITCGHRIITGKRPSAP
jgi:hypothetical protein